MDEKAKVKLTKARCELMMKKPFFGYLVSYLTFVENESVGIEINGRATCGVDDRGNLYYAPSFINQLSHREVQTILAHEVMHIATCTHTRKKWRKKDKWNVAADYAINELLCQDGFVMPQGGCLNSHFRELSAEEIYDKLPDMPTKQTWCVGVIKPGKGKGKGKGIGVIVGKGKKAGKGKSLGEASGKGMDKDWQKILAEAAMYAKSIGKDPAFADRLLKDVLSEQVDWRAIIYKQLLQVIKSKQTYMRPNTRREDRQIIFPKWENDKSEVIIALDTSGSIGQEELETFAGEMMTMCRQLPQLHLTVLSCDAEVHSVQEFDSNSYSPYRLKVKGGGGTSFVPVFEWIDKKMPFANLLIYFTDLMGEFPKIGMVPTLWVSTMKSEKAPFGDTTYISSEQLRR